MPLTTKARIAAAVVAGCAVTSVIAAPANAAFTSPKFSSQCAGSSITGNGASFQVNLQGKTSPSGGEIGAFINGAGTFDPVCTQFKFPSTGPASITYLGGGSGAGRRAFGERSGTNTTGARGAGQDVRYAGVDEAPNTTQKGQINNGLDATGDEAEVRTIPIAAGSITVSVNFPDGCVIPSGNAFNPDSDGTTRFITQNSAIERVFYGVASQRRWGVLLPGISGTQAGTGTDCAQVPVKRIVRANASGTTFAFKSWLQTINPSRNPTWSFFATDAQNITWPNEVTGDPIKINDNSGVANGVRSNDGSIGYIDLATARQYGFEKNGYPGDPSTSPPAGTTAANDTTYWIPVQNGSSEFADPQENGDGYRPDPAVGESSDTKGANCSGVTFTAPTAADGSALPAGADQTKDGIYAQVLGVNSNESYGICALTYTLAFDDYCDAFGTSDAEQAKARSVFDYIRFITGNVGQEIARSLDYAPLPPSVLSSAQQGSSRIGWRKAGGGCV